MAIDIFTRKGAGTAVAGSWHVGSPGAPRWVLNTTEEEEEEEEEEKVKGEKAENITEEEDQEEEEEGQRHKTTK